MASRRLRLIRKEFPQARIILLTTYSGDVQASRALKAGAAGYLLKGMFRTDLIKTIRRVHAGHRHVPEEIVADIAEHFSEDLLSPREVDVLRGVAAGVLKQDSCVPACDFGRDGQRAHEECAGQAQRQ